MGLGSSTVGQAGPVRVLLSGAGVATLVLGLYPNCLSPQGKNYKAICLELKPEPIKVRSSFEPMPAPRPESRGS